MTKVVRYERKERRFPDEWETEWRIPDKQVTPQTKQVLTRLIARYLRYFPHARIVQDDIGIGQGKAQIS